MFRQNTFSKASRGMRPGRRRKSWMTGLSPRKIVRVAIVLMMSFLCWIGIGCFAFEMLQLAGR
jgi:hypothetical protein